MCPTVEHLVTEDGKSYIRATFSGDERPYACDGRYRIRGADEDLPMSAEALERMMLERAARRDPWDGRPSGRSLSEVDEETLRAYVERGVERRRIPFGYTDARDALARLGPLCDDGCLTNAAAARFRPSKNVMLRMGVLADSERVHILDNRQETGALFQLVEAAELYILNNVRRAFVIDGSSLHREKGPRFRSARSARRCSTRSATGATRTTRRYRSTYSGTPWAYTAPVPFPQGTRRRTTCPAR